MWWMIAGSLLSTLVVLFLLGRRNERAVSRDWELLLGPKGQKLYHRFEDKLLAEVDLADLSYDEAIVAKELGSVDEAIELLRSGYRVIELFAPSMLRLLAAMATFSRMVAALTPMPPLRPRDFRLAQLVSLAYLNQILHQFLVSSAERFRLRAYVLGLGFNLVIRFLFRSTHRIAARAPEAEREWEQVDLVRRDFRALTEESLAMLRVLLGSLETTDQARALARKLGA